MDVLFWRRMHGGGAHLAIALLLASGLLVAPALMGDPLTPAASTNAVSASEPTAEVAAGHQLYLMNCAHCHAPDATGDEGPDLHDVGKSDARIAAMIKNGVKGQMPKFGSKLSDQDVQKLIAFIRSLH